MEPPSQNEQQPKPSRDGEGGGKNPFYWHQIFTRPRFCCCKNTNIVYLAWRLPYLCNATSQRNNLIKLTHQDEKKRKGMTAHRQSELKKTSFFIFCNTLSRGLRAGLITSYCQGTKCKNKKRAINRIKSLYTRRDRYTTGSVVVVVVYCYSHCWSL